MNSIQKTKFDPDTIRGDFPILNQTIHRDRPLVYFDNGASAQRPQAVIDAMDDCYRQTYANVHRGIHWLSEQATAQYEQARIRVQKFINAPHDNEIIFTSGTTESINLVAHSWGNENIAAGDEILLTIFEHHSNIVPWQQLAARTGAQVRFIGIDEQGELDYADFQQKLNERTRMVAFSGISNMLGTIVAVEKAVELARSVGAKTLIDAAQWVPHEPTDVRKWNADFVAFGAHKMLGPSGIGVLWGKQELLEAMPPFLGGGSMIDRVTVDGFTPGELPAKFEAGTPPIVEAIGLGAAIDYLNRIDMESVRQHEHELVSLAWKKLSAIEGLKIYGPPPTQRTGLLSFTIAGVSPQDIAILIDQQGFAIRAGHHCTMPLHEFLGIRASCRASFYLYNTLAEVERFSDALNKVVTRLR